MTTLEMGRSTAAVGFGSFAARFIAMLSAWNDARITRGALDRLTDRELTDIGLTRADIDRVARSAV